MGGFHIPGTVSHSAGTTGMRGAGEHGKGTQRSHPPKRNSGIPQSHPRMATKSAGLHVCMLHVCITCLGGICSPRAYLKNSSQHTKGLVKSHIALSRDYFLALDWEHGAVVLQIQIQVSDSPSCHSPNYFKSSTYFPV